MDEGAGTMTPDLNHSISVHNTKMAQYWKVPEYIIERKAFIKRNPVCCRCGRPATTPVHSPEDYLNYDRYLAAVVNDKCVPLCSACNLMERSNRRPCPECIKQKKEHIRYIGQDQEMCFYCVPQELQEIRKKKKEGFAKFIRKLRDADNARRNGIYQERKKAGKGGA
jgi:hypothetical protein